MSQKHPFSPLICLANAAMGDKIKKTIKTEYTICSNNLHNAVKYDKFKMIDINESFV